MLFRSRSHQSLIVFSKTVASLCRARTLSTELDFGVALTSLTESSRGTSRDQESVGKEACFYTKKQWACDCARTMSKMKTKVKKRQKWTDLEIN